MNTEIEKRKQEVWQETVESCSTKRCSGKYYKILRDLAGKRSPLDPNQPITFQGQTLSDRRKIASRFVRQFTRPSPHAQNPVTRKLLRRIHNHYHLDHHHSPFTTTQVYNAIKASNNSTAPNADSITIHQLNTLDRWSSATSLPSSTCPSNMPTSPQSGNTLSFFQS